MRGLVKGLQGMACAALCLFLFGGACADVAMADTATPVIARVVTANTDQWSDLHAIDCAGPDPCEVRTTDCNALVKNTQLAPGTSIIVAGAAKNQCIAVAPVDLLKFQIVSGTPSIATLAFFKTPINVAAVYIPALETGEALRGRVLQNDDSFSTTFSLFNESSGSLWVTLSFYNGLDLLGEDVALLQPGHNFIDNIATRFSAARVEIHRGAPFVGCQGCAPDTSIAGVAFVNWRSGGSPRAVPLTPIQ
jgi:hypothetical protein